MPAYLGNEPVSEQNIEDIRKLYNDIIFDILGLQPIESSSTNNEMLEKVIQVIIEERLIAKQRKDYETSDRIRNKLNEIGIEIKDTKNGSEWKIK